MNTSDRLLKAAFFFGEEQVYCFRAKRDVLCAKSEQNQMVDLMYLHIVPYTGLSAGRKRHRKAEELAQNHRPLHCIV
jgi:hypothetical protein